jgi:hypothetical protein
MDVAGHRGNMVNKVTCCPVGLEETWLAQTSEYVQGELLSYLKPEVSFNLHIRLCSSWSLRK